MSCAHAAIRWMSVSFFFFFFFSIQVWCAVFRVWGFNGSHFPDYFFCGSPLLERLDIFSVISHYILSNPFFKWRTCAAHLSTSLLLLVLLQLLQL
ncbi:hypothetical protein GQ55_9G214500 [Panicum hallii var. hallii]|uniref:Uncharacterized protein n=1 Tax=Panicum hallii var. hallii TaxID=1504633 RepID=A0A2T7C5P0_9POAL|nr:hypothetical protein GQ55_9G214500 [Panicum hallii var. hallii]